MTRRHQFASSRIITKCNFHKNNCLLTFTQRTFHPVNLRFICHRFASSPCLLVANDGKQTNKKFFLWQLRTNSCSKFRFHSFRVISGTISIIVSLRVSLECKLALGSLVCGNSIPKKDILRRECDFS